MDAFSDPSLLVATTAGVVRGTQDGNTHRWLGVPYGKAPVGELRYRRSLPVEPWQGTRDALEFGNIAPQEPTKLIPIPTGVEIDEDCLNLNIWAPIPKPGDKPKPVMFWIHGNWLQYAILPDTVTLPDTVGHSFISPLRSVVFPVPTRPTMQSRAPSGTEKFTSLRVSAMLE